MQLTVSVADEPAVIAPIVIPEPVINELLVMGPAGQPVPEQLTALAGGQVRPVTGVSLTVAPVTP